MVSGRGKVGPMVPTGQARELVSLSTRGCRNRAVPIRAPSYASIRERTNLLRQRQNLPGEVEQLDVLLVLLLHREPLMVGDHLALGVGAVLGDHHKGRQEDR